MHPVMNPMKAGTRDTGESTAVILIEKVTMESLKMGNLVMMSTDGNLVFLFQLR